MSTINVFTAAFRGCVKWLRSLRRAPGLHQSRPASIGDVPEDVARRHFQQMREAVRRA